MKNDDILCCSLTVDMTDDQLHEIMHKMFARLEKSERGFLFTIEGYGHDPRELWEIPEAVTFCKKLVDIGFISLLEPIAEMAMPGTSAFGAMEVWLVATGMIKEKKQYPITQQMVMDLMKVLDQSNMKLNDVLNKPCPKTDICEIEHVIAGTDTVPDGQNKRKTSKKNGQHHRN